MESVKLNAIDIETTHAEVKIYRSVPLRTKEKSVFWDHFVVSLSAFSEHWALRISALNTILFCLLCHSTKWVWLKNSSQGYQKKLGFFFSFHLHNKGSNTKSANLSQLSYKIYLALLQLYSYLANNSRPLKVYFYQGIGSRNWSSFPLIGLR